MRILIESSNKGLVLDQNSTRVDIHKAFSSTKPGDRIKVTMLNGKEVTFIYRDPYIQVDYIDPTEGGPGYERVTIKEWVAEDPSYEGSSSLRRGYPAEYMSNHVAHGLLIDQTWKSVEFLS